MAKGSCQSGAFKKPQKIEQPTIRYGTWGSIVNAFGQPDASSVTCASDEIVIAGGGACYDPGRAWVHTSMPDGNNGWVVNCFGRDTNTWSITQDSMAIAFAVCLKKQ